MSKRKLSKQYASKKEKYEDIKDKDINLVEDNSNVKKIKNTTNIGNLYLNAKNDDLNVSQEKSILYMGKSKFVIKTEYNPVSIFNDYFMFVLNNVCGYITNSDVDIDMIKNDPSTTLTHMFLSILYYNSIIIPSNIKIVKHDSHMLLGECLYYNKTYEKNELIIHVCNKLVSNILNDKSIYDINFSTKINYEQYSMKDNLQQFDDNVVITEEMYKILLNIFVIADHAATHFIEDYILNKTDWIHHFCFAKEINSFTLINTIFNISANVSNVDTTPKLIVNNKKGPINSGPLDIERLFEESQSHIENINSVNFDF